MPRLKRDLTMEQQLARGPLDMPFLMLVVLLTAIGVIMVFSASYATALNQGRPATYYFMRQAAFAGVGLVGMYVISKINYQHFRWMSVFILGLSIVLLILVFPLGYGKAEVGAQRWIRMPVIGSLQPSEVAKVGVILYFAARLCKRNTEKKRYFDRDLTKGKVLAALDRIGFLELVPYILILGLVMLLMLLEPHMSGTILIFVGAASVLFAAGIHWGWFLGGGSVVALALWFIITKTPYMTKRINLWRDPWAFPIDGGYQIIQSLYAIGSGGLFGVGFGQGRQKLGFLPEPENDFVFSVVCEELGLIGAGLILALFVMLVLRGYWIALHARDRFGSLMVVGIITLLAVQVFLNISVVTNFMPTTGISLPFFSYGGTALIIQLGEMGIVLSVSRQAPAGKQG